MLLTQQTADRLVLLHRPRCIGIGNGRSGRYLLPGRTIRAVNKINVSATPVLGLMVFNDPLTRPIPRLPDSRIHPILRGILQGVAITRNPLVPGQNTKHPHVRQYPFVTCCFPDNVMMLGNLNMLLGGDFTTWET